jgi:hypothetical protein
MKIKFREDHATDKQMYWAGKVYDVPDKLGEAWVSAGIGEAIVPPRPARRTRKRVEEDE